MIFSVNGAGAMSGSLWFQGYDEVESSRVSSDLQRLAVTNLQRPFQGFKNIRGTGPWVAASPSPRANVRVAASRLTQAGIRRGLAANAGLTSGRRFAANPGRHPTWSRG